MWPFAVKLRSEWNHNPWRGKSILGEHAKCESAPTAFARAIAKNAKRVVIPVHIWLGKTHSIGVDSSGRTVMWGFGLEVLWPDASQGRDDDDILKLINHAYMDTDDIGAISSRSKAYADYEHALREARGGREWRCNFRARHFRDPRVVALALADLRSSHSEVRQNAVRVLAKTNDRHHAEALMPLLEDDNVRQAAAEALAQLGVDHPKLIAYLASDMEKSYRSVDLLGLLAASRCAPAVEILSRAFANARSGPERAEMRRRLSLGGKLAMPAFINALSSSDRMTRLQGVVGLGETGEPDPDAVQALLALMQASDEEWAVIEALGKMNAKDAVEPVVAFIKSQRVSPGLENGMKLLGEVHTPFASMVLDRLIAEGTDDLRAALKVARQG